MRGVLRNLDQSRRDRLLLLTTRLNIEYAFPGIEQISKDALQLNQGTLYPALLRMEQEGWIGRLARERG